MKSVRAVPVLLCALLLALLGVLAPIPERHAPAFGDEETTQDGGSLHLGVDSMRPKVVSGDTGKLKVSGTVRNTGDRPVNDIALRLQVADPVRSEHELAKVMAKPPLTASSKSSFHGLSKRLRPGQSTRFEVTVDLSTSSLKLPSTGIYPLTVNVNGRPDYGGDARLASLNTLLPVRSVPGTNSSSEPESKNSFGLSMLWPIAGTPSQFGRTRSGQVILTDDALAAELRPGGRLYALVHQGARRLVKDPKLSQSACFAVDPELLQAVAAMRGGYQVRTKNGGTVAGTGAKAARAWLDELSEVTKGRCVVPVPYARADLVALARGGERELEKRALDDSVLAELLPGANLRSEVAIPDDGLLDERTAGDLAHFGKSTAVLREGNLSGRTGPRKLSGSGLTGVTTDPLLDRGLAGEPRTDRSSAGALTPANSPAVASSNGIAALIYRAQFDQDPPKRVFAVPPMRWNTSGADVTDWLNIIERLFQENAAHPESASKLLGESASGSSAKLRYPSSLEQEEIPGSVTRALARQGTKIEDLRGAMRKDSASDATPSALSSGLQEGLLRAVSGAWRGDPSAARVALEDSRKRLRNFADRVSAGSSSLPLSLASKNSQLPVSISNRLPVNMKVRVSLHSAGVRTEQRYTELWVPANNSRTLYIPVTVQRSGRFNVDIRLTTPGGTQLGEPVRADVGSSAFGVVTVAITATAFVALILLVGRRLYRRVRASRRNGHDERK